MNMVESMMWESESEKNECFENSQKLKSMFCGPSSPGIGEKKRNRTGILFCDSNFHLCDLGKVFFCGGGEELLSQITHLNKPVEKERGREKERVQG